MKKLLAFALLAALVAGVVLFFMAERALRRATELALPAARRAMDSNGIVLDAVTLGEVGLSLPLDGSWKDVKARVESTRDSALARRAAFDVSIGEIQARPLSPSLSRVRLTLRNVSASEVYSLRAPGEADIGGLWIRVDRFSRVVELDASDPLPALREEIEAAREILRRGVTAKPFKLEGAFGFRFKDRVIELSLHSARREGGYGLEADRDGVEELAAAHSEPLTPAEIDVVTRYPLQAPRMLQIMQYAAIKALRAREKDRGVSQDAYRHVLWSYLLTLQFGPELAETITDAHEIGSTTNTEADHRMDYNNNNVGRAYALEGRSEGEILGLSKTAPEVIRAPR